MVFSKSYTPGVHEMASFKPRARVHHGECKMKIYVGTLSKNSTEEGLQRVFEAFGTVSAVTLMDNSFTDHHNGSGVVEMPSEVEALAAISALDGQAFRGQAMTANKVGPCSGGKPYFEYL
jgi:RNA recognition motif-containing protein